MQFFPRSAKALSLTLLGATCALLLCELVASFFSPLPPQLLGAEKVAAFIPGIERKKIIPDPIAGYIPNPARLAETGTHGFQNGREFSTPGRRTWAILGDSLIAKGGLAEELSGLLPPDHRLYYLGVPGYNTAQEVYYYRNFVKLRPDVLLLSFCLNDFFPSMGLVPAADESGSKWEMRQNLFEPLELNPWLYQRSHLYRLFTFAKLTRKITEDKLAPFRLEKLQPAMEKRLKKFRDQLRRSNTRLVVILYPALLPPEEEPKWTRMARAQILEILQRLDIEFIDTLPEFAANPVKYRETESDFIHPSREGHGMVAKKIFRTLIQ